MKLVVGAMMALLLLLLCMPGAAVGAEEDSPPPIPVLDSRIMLLSHEAAKLSALAYEDAAQYAVLDGTNGTATVVGYDHPDYEAITFYTNEPDQAIVARTRDGRCYISFRGTQLNLADWEQNIDLGSRTVHRDNNTDNVDDACEARRGFTDFLWTPEVFRGTKDTWACAERCDDPDDCLVITGHSQGGASATIAAIMLHGARPTVITFGQPPSVDADCPFIPSDRYYRYVNSRVEEGEDDDLGIDPVPFSPTFVSMSSHYGYALMLGDDASASGSGVKYLGFDDDYDFTPSIFDVNEISAHDIDESEHSYGVRVEGLLNQGQFPVSVEGFADGSICDDDAEVFCASERCLNNICTPTTEELGCDEAADGELPNGCPCSFDSDCRGDCDGFFTRVCVGAEEQTRGVPVVLGDGTSGIASLMSSAPVALAINAVGCLFLSVFFMV